MFIIISGPSGVGKNTIINELIKLNKNLEIMKTCTTRINERSGENNYIFLSKEDFENKIKSGEFFEFEEIHGNFYGTLNSSIDKIVEAKNNYIKDIGVLGQKNFVKKLGKKVKILSIFLTASKDVLIERLKNRGEKNIDKRLERFDFENSFKKNYDLVIDNNNLEETISKIQKKLQSM